MTDPVERAGTAAAGLPLHEVARVLLAGVGSVVVQAMTGVTDRDAVARWADPATPEPSPDVAARVRLGYQVWPLLADTEGPNVALSWLVGANPRLSDTTPVTAIRDQRAVDVLGAAVAFTDGSPPA